MEKKRQMLLVDLKKLPTQNDGWIKIPPDLDSQYQIEREDLEILKKSGEISSFEEYYYDFLPFWQTSHEGLNYTKNYIWKIKFSLSSKLKNWINSFFK